MGACPTPPGPEGSNGKQSDYGRGFPWPFKQT